MAKYGAGWGQKGQEEDSKQELFLNLLIMKYQFGGEVIATQYQDVKSSDLCKQNIKSHSLQESIWSKPAGELIQDT